MKKTRFIFALTLFATLVLSSCMKSEYGAIYGLDTEYDETTSDVFYQGLHEPDGLEIEREKPSFCKKEESDDAAKKKLTGYDEEFVSRLTGEEQSEAQYFLSEGFVFYRQNWSVLKDLPYGDDNFGQCGCGPTCVAEIVSTLAGVRVNPEEMRVWSMEHNCYIANAGTTDYFMLYVPELYGVRATHVSAGNKDMVVQALREGKLILVTMGPGDFTLGAHYMLYRGVTEDGKILISDSYSYKNSVLEWDWDVLNAQQIQNGYWIYDLIDE